MTDFSVAPLQAKKIDSDRHLFHTEIKGITYHQFEVSGDESGWQARIILDV